MSFILDLITGDALPYLLAAGAALASFIAYGSSKKKQGRTEAETDAMKDSVKRQERGRDAVQDLRGVDRAGLLKQLRDNDDEH